MSDNIENKNYLKLSKTQFLIAKLIIFIVGFLFIYLFFSRYIFDLQILIMIGLALIAFLPQKSMVVFLKDWWPLAAGVYIYSLLRGFVDNWSPWLHSEIIINAERAIFGLIPTEWLQEVLYVPGQVHWYDIVSLYFYISFFLFPFIVGYVLWLYRRQYYKIFAFGFLLLCYLGLLGYFFFPLVPPWLASLNGNLSVVRITGLVPQVMGITYNHVTVVVSNFSPNLVAAFPSLHSAWPFFCSLMLWHYFRWKYAVSFIFPIGTWFAVVYFGEHYVIDVVAGMVFAGVSYFITIKWYKERVLKTTKLNEDSEL